MDEQERARRHLLIQSEEPLNAEPPPERLIEKFVTPQAFFYIRSHGVVPTLTGDHPVRIEGLVERPASWTRADLEAQFTVRTVTAVMQCAGNRRADLQQVKETAGDPWGPGAIGNAEWTGVRLADVLEAARIDRGAARHIRFLAADMVEVEGETDRFGVSIPLAKALHPDTLIVWAMNGEPLLPEHGAPLRIVVPGYAGVRSPKWLTQIEVSAEPATQPIQAKDYKLFPASVAKEDADWSAGMVINALPINAAICSPVDGAALQAGDLLMQGYATAGDRAVSRVDVSVNGGRDWEQAELERRDDEPWSWTRWSWSGELGKGSHELVVRAVDDAGQGQPARPDDIWNFAGYLATHWHRVQVRVD